MKTKILNPFLPNVPGLHHLKALENYYFSDVFRRDKKETLKRNGLNVYN